MEEKDALKGYVFPKKIGKFVSFVEGEALKIRVLTVDPLVAVDKWGGTKFAFIVYNFTDSKAQILNAGATIFKEIQKLHIDEDYGQNIKMIDIKILAEGEGMDRKYTVTPLPKATTLTNEQILEAKEIVLEDEIEGGTRLSKVDNSAMKPGPATYDETEPIDLSDAEPMDISQIPF